MCVLLPSGCWDRLQHCRNPKQPQCRDTAQTHSVPVFEEAAETEGDEFEDGFQHEGGGEEIVAVLEAEIQGLEREHYRRLLCMCV